jgi:thiol-disulfide isomerase/thioredoxin
MRRHSTMAGLLVAFVASATSAAAQDIGLPLGSVPDRVEIEDLDGVAVDLGTHVGLKPVLIEFWATWCPLCQALEPRLHAAAAAYGDDLEILIIAVGVNQSPRTIRRHMTGHEMPGTVLFDGRGRAARAFRAPSTSYIVALDAAGRVVYTGIGADQDIAAAARAAVGR